jgi:Ca-activated chloride channel family protein
MRYIPVLLSLALAAPLAAQQFKTSTSTVRLAVTVLDRDKRLVPDLVQEDFEVYDNGKLQAITTFDNQPTPFTAVVMLDTSGSMTLALDRVKEAAEQFLIRMFPGDTAKIGYFNDKVRVLPETGEFLSDRDRLIRILKDELDFGYPTRLYDGAYYALAALRDHGGDDKRKVVLLFTDGDDTASKFDMGDVLERARAEDVMVYSIGLQSDYFNGQQRVRTRPDRGLKKLSEETGGGYFELKKTDDLGATFTRVAQELHSQYLVGFSPEVLDGKIHKIDVRFRKPDMTPRTRKSYVAAAMTTEGGGGR